MMFISTPKRIKEMCHSALNREGNRDRRSAIARVFSQAHQAERLGMTQVILSSVELDLISFVPKDFFGG